MSRSKESGRRAQRKRTKQAKKRKAQRNKEHLAGAFHRLLSEESIFAKIKLHGNTKWLPKNLVCLALLWAFSESRHLTDAYAEAVLCHQSMFGSVIPGTYQGFMGALTRWTGTLMAVLWPGPTRLVARLRLSPCFALSGLPGLRGLGTQGVALG